MGILIPLHWCHQLLSRSKLITGIQRIRHSRAWLGKRHHLTLLKLQERGRFASRTMCEFVTLMQIPQVSGDLEHFRDSSMPTHHLPKKKRRHVPFPRSDVDRLYFVVREKRTVKHSLANHHHNQIAIMPCWLSSRPPISMSRLICGLFNRRR